MLLVIEGIDAAGKATQTRRLVERYRACGRQAATMSFPRYGQGVFADAIAEYLNGRFGPLESVAPQLAAMLFAGDRFEHLHRLEKSMNEHDVVVLDRYVASNLAYQGARADADDRGRLLSWIERLEYEVYGLPVPDHTLLLDVPPPVAADLLHRKSARQYTDDAADLHERNRTFIQAVHSVYHELAANDPERWSIIACHDADGRLADEATIAGRIEEAIRAAGIAIPADA